MTYVRSRTKQFGSRRQDDKPLSFVATVHQLDAARKRKPLETNKVRKLIIPILFIPLYYPFSRLCGLLVIRISCFSKGEKITDGQKFMWDVNLNLLFMILLRIRGKRLGVLWVALASRGGGEKSPIGNLIKDGGSLLAEAFFPFYSLS